MERRKKPFTSIDGFIRVYPKPVQQKLTELRRTIKELAPQAEEKISYQMPTFYLNGNLIHFAAYAKHIGFYPTPSVISTFENKLTKFKYSRGAVQFPVDEPLPLGLIKQIVKFRVVENTKKEKK